MIDLIFTAGSIIFIIGLAPAATDPMTRVPLKTSLPTAIVLFAYACTFTVMGLHFSALSSAVLAGLWAVIALKGRP